MKKNNFKTDSNRIDYLDVAKAIGMYLFILGHLVIMNYKPYRIIYAFHMPLFFIISGMTDALKTQDDFVLFVKNKLSIIKFRFLSFFYYQYCAVLCISGYMAKIC